MRPHCIAQGTIANLSAVIPGPLEKPSLCLKVSILCGCVCVKWKLIR